MSCIEVGTVRQQQLTKLQYLWWNREKIIRVFYFVLLGSSFFQYPYSSVTGLFIYVGLNNTGWGYVKPIFCISWVKYQIRQRAAIFLPTISTQGYISESPMGTEPRPTSFWRQKWGISTPLYLTPLLNKWTPLRENVIMGIVRVSITTKYRMSQTWKPMFPLSPDFLFVKKNTPHLHMSTTEEEKRTYKRTFSQWNSLKVDKCREQCNMKEIYTVIQFLFVKKNTLHLHMSTTEKEKRTYKRIFVA